MRIRDGFRIFLGIFYLVCLKVFQRLTALNKLSLELFDGVLELAHLLRQLPMGSVVACLHLRPLFEETHERVSFSVPFIVFPFRWVKALKVGG